MKSKFVRLKYAVCLLSQLLLAATHLYAQAPASHTRRFISPDANINGFYEYLPRGYAFENPKKYPLIIFIHGVGECGTVQDNVTLDKVMAWGPPQIINNKMLNNAGVQFPDSFRVAGTGAWFKFIVLSVQIKAGLDNTTVTDTIRPATVDAMVEYAKANYRVDLSRIYLCGLSMGGGATWDYAGSSNTAAKKIAAIAVACGAGDLTTAEANIIAAAKIPILSTHNKGDATVNWNRTSANVTKVNAYVPAISPIPKPVYWAGGAHNVWSRTFEDINPGVTTQGLTGNLRDTLGMNVYQWLLQFTRASTLPLTWKSFTGTVVSNKVVLNWMVANQQEVEKYSIEKSRDGRTWVETGTVMAQPNSNTELAYSYEEAAMYHEPCFYRLKQIDLDNHYSYSSIIKLLNNQVTELAVNIYPNPFNRQLVLDIVASTATPVILKMMNIAGVELLKKEYSLDEATNHLTVDHLKTLSGGVYYLSIENKKGTTLYHSLIVKQ